ncbi:MAG: putative integral membrane protein [Parasphingorhabdus sp.]|jgi:uncharacterized integral membrane protein
MKKLLYAILFLVVMVVGLTFAVRNPQSVTISYYFGIEFTLPLIVFLLVILTSGILTGYFLAHLGRFRGMRKKRRRQQLAATTPPTQTIAATRLTE